MFRRLFLRAAWLGLLLCSGLPAAGVAAERAGTLGRIAETATINLGHRESSVPF